MAGTAPTMVRACHLSDRNMGTLRVHRTIQKIQPKYYESPPASLLPFDPHDTTLRPSTLVGRREIGAFERSVDTRHPKHQPFSWESACARRVKRKWQAALETCLHHANRGRKNEHAVACSQVFSALRGGSGVGDLVGSCEPSRPLLIFFVES